MPKRFKVIINGVPQQEINFEVMGLDYPTSDFLNWCMRNMNNLEFIKECKTLEKPSKAYTFHIDHLKVIRKIDEIISHNRSGI